jgi:3-oxoacyl-[acyl-carrier-protein] synthase II
VDESTELLQKNTSRISRGLSSKASEGRRTTIPGEGAVFFCLHADPTQARYGFNEELSLSRGNTKISDVMPTFFSGAASQKRRDPIPATLHDFSSVYGNLPTAMALDIVLAACALSGKFFPHISSTDGIRCLSRDRFDTLGGLTVTPLEIS